MRAVADPFFIQKVVGGTVGGVTGLLALAGALVTAVYSRQTYHRRAKQRLIQDQIYNLVIGIRPMGPLLISSANDIPSAKKHVVSMVLQLCAQFQQSVLPTRAHEHLIRRCHGLSRKIKRCMPVGTFLGNAHSPSCTSLQADPQKNLDDSCSRPLLQDRSFSNQHAPCKACYMLLHEHLLHLQGRINVDRFYNLLPFFNRMPRNHFYASLSSKVAGFFMKLWQPLKLKESSPGFDMM